MRAQVRIPFFGKTKLAVNVLGVGWFLENLTNPSALHAVDVVDWFTLVALFAQLLAPLWTAGRDVGEALACKELLFLGRKNERLAGIFVGQGDVLKLWLEIHSLVIP